MVMDGDARVELIILATQSWLSQLIRVYSRFSVIFYVCI